MCTHVHAHTQKVQKKNQNISKSSISRKCERSGLEIAVWLQTQTGTCWCWRVCARVPIYMPLWQSIALTCEEKVETLYQIFERRLNSFFLWITMTRVAANNIDGNSHEGYSGTMPYSSVFSCAAALLSSIMHTLSLQFSHELSRILICIIPLYLKFSCRQPYGGRLN